MSSGAKKDLLDAGILSHEEQLSILRAENAELRRKLEAVTRARDAWRKEATALTIDHSYDCARAVQVEGNGYALVDGIECDCPAALDLEAEKVAGRELDGVVHDGYPEVAS